MKKIILITLLFLTSSIAFAEGDSDPCELAKITASFQGQGGVVNCYIDEALAAYAEQRAKIQAETPADKAGSDARWESMAEIDKLVADLTSKKISDVKFANAQEGLVSSN